MATEENAHSLWSQSQNTKGRKSALEEAVAPALGRALGTGLGEELDMIFTNKCSWNFFFYYY